jgi:UDP-glucose 4-epimerase
MAKATGKKRVVVTGGAGFIGSHLVEVLLKKGYNVDVVDTFVGGKREDRIFKKARYHTIDIRDTEALVPIFKEAFGVFHEAALPRVQFSIENPVETFSVNVSGTVSVLRAAHTAQVRRVVYAASSSAYGDQEMLPLHEDLPAMPKSPYGLQKYMGEELCRLWSGVYGLPTVALRYFNVYGSRFDPKGAYALVIGKFLEQKARSKPLTVTGDGTQTRDFTHVRDIVRANISALLSRNVGRGETINVGVGKNVSINNLARLISTNITYVPARLEIHDTRADNRKAKKLLGWKPEITLKDGVEELLKDKSLMRMLASD